MVVVGAVVVLDGNVLSDWLQGRCPKKKWGKEKWTRYIFRSLSYRLSANCVSVFAPCYLDGSPQWGLYDFDVFISYFICHRHAHVLFILK